MIVDFLQVDCNGKVLIGVLMLKKFGKLCFQYEKGVLILIVVEGGVLIFVDYLVKQVQCWLIKNLLLGVLFDFSCDIICFVCFVFGVDLWIVLVEVNDVKYFEYGWIILVFVCDVVVLVGLMLQGWVVLDSQNNCIMIWLSNQKFGVLVLDNIFKWNDLCCVGLRK